jgi:hypothetical protein
MGGLYLNIPVNTLRDAKLNNSASLKEGSISQHKKDYFDKRDKKVYRSEEDMS